MPSDQQNSEDFDRWANDADAWLLHARDLHTSATLLREKFTETQVDSPDPIEGLQRALPFIGLPFVAAMLQGFSIEAYLKAFFIRAGNPVSKDGRYSISGINDSHNLVSIADGVKFGISTAERDILAKLSLFVSSYGRYPITRRWQQAPLRPDSRGIPHRVGWSDSDHETAESIIGRLEQATKKA